MFFQLDVRSDFTFIRIKLAGAVCCVVLVSYGELSWQALSRTSGWSGAAPSQGW